MLGWGSLIWCPGGLRIKTKWRSDGPMSQSSRQVLKPSTNGSTLCIRPTAVFSGTSKLLDIALLGASIQSFRTRLILRAGRLSLRLIQGAF